MLFYVIYSGKSLRLQIAFLLYPIFVQEEERINKQTGLQRSELGTSIAFNCKVSISLCEDKKKYHQQT